MRRLLLAVVLLAPAAPSRAAFEDLGAGARAPGMGGAFVPIADDVYALYYNPAGLGLLERPQLGSAYTALYPGLKDGSSLGHSWLGYAHPLKEGKHGTLAASWSSLTLNSLYREDALAVGYGRRLRALGEGELYGGGAAKYLRSSFGSFAEANSAVPTGGLVGGGQPDPTLRGKSSQGAVDLDAGLLWRLARHYTLAMDVMHANQPDVSFGGAPDKLPVIVKTGVGYRSLVSNLAFQHETQRSPLGGRDHRITAAAERWFPKLFVGDFGLRGALGVGSRDDRQVSVGVTYRSRRFSADYAAGFPLAGAASLISAHRVGLSFRFGRPTDEEESLEMVLEAMRQFKLRPEKGPAAAVADAQKRTLDELLGQARSSEAHAKYAEALERLGRALTVGTPDKSLVARHAKLSAVAGQFNSLPGYREDPMEASLHLGVLAHLNGDGVHAVQKVSEAHALAPGRADVESFLRQLERESGVRRKVFATGETPDKQTSVLLTRANAALEDKRWDEAVELSLAVLRLDPDNAAAWANLGTAYFALRAFEDSLKAWEKAYSLEKSPAVRTAIRGYIRSVTRQQDKRQAKRAAPTPDAPSRPEPAAPRSIPDKPRLTPAESQDLFNRAVDHYTRGEKEEARTLLEKILESDPDNVEAQKALRRVKAELP